MISRRLTRLSTTQKVGTTWGLLYQIPRTLHYLPQSGRSLLRTSPILESTLRHPTEDTVYESNETEFQEETNYFPENSETTNTTNVGNNDDPSLPSDNTVNMRSLPNEEAAKFVDHILHPLSEGSVMPANGDVPLVEFHCNTPIEDFLNHLKKSSRQGSNPCLYFPAKLTCP